MVVGRWVDLGHARPRIDPPTPTISAFGGGGAFGSETHPTSALTVPHTASRRVHPMHFDQGTQPMPSCCSPDGKRQLQWHL